MRPLPWIHWEAQACSCRCSSQTHQKETLCFCVSDSFVGLSACRSLVLWASGSAGCAFCWEELASSPPLPQTPPLQAGLTKTIRLWLRSAHRYWKQGSVNFKVFLWGRSVLNADVKGDRWEGHMSSAPPHQPAQGTWMLHWNPLVVEYFCCLDSHEGGDTVSAWSLQQPAYEKLLTVSLFHSINEKGQKIKKHAISEGKSWPRTPKAKLCKWRQAK